MCYLIICAATVTEYSEIDEEEEEVEEADDDYDDNDNDDEEEEEEETDVQTDDTEVEDDAETNESYDDDDDGDVHVGASTVRTGGTCMLQNGISIRRSESTFHQNFRVLLLYYVFIYEIHSILKFY